MKNIAHKLVFDFLEFSFFLFLFLRAIPGLLMLHDEYRFTDVNLLSDTIHHTHQLSILSISFITYFVSILAHDMSTTWSSL